jgi:RimJ/RimL family protein N-acetyltransferase
MELADMGLRIDYFHDADDETLELLGVGRDRLPSRADWLAAYEEDFRRPLAERRGYGVIWELDRAAIGFSTAEPIEFGHQAHMHLHILRPEMRRRGLGTELVRLTARHYFEVLELERIFCQPNALNEAPNRALQAAGFRYVRTHEVAPTPINPPQLTTLWVLER